MTPTDLPPGPTCGDALVVTQRLTGDRRVIGIGVAFDIVLSRYVGGGVLPRPSGTPCDWVTAGCRVEALRPGSGRHTPKIVVDAYKMTQVSIDISKMVTLI